MTAADQASNYVRKIEPAISGANGHGTTYHVAAILIEGFALSIAEARPILAEYAARCQPPWSDREIDHKLQSVKIDPSQLGKMIRAGVRWRHSSPKPAAIYPAPHREPPKQSKVAAPATYEISDALELPEPIPDGARAFLRAVFASGEGIQIQIGSNNEDGKEIPKDSGVILTREEWITRLDAVDGNPNKIFSTSERNGIYVRVNPMARGGSKDSDVTAFRHALLEFDSIPPVEQYGVITQSGVPCSAIISSGGKSIHAWVRIEAATRQEYDDRVKFLYDHFAGYKPDTQNKNPSRFSRLPFCERGKRRQELLSLKCGAASFIDWEAANTVRESKLPPIDNAEISINEPVILPEELIAGVLHRSCKCIIGGSSKARKTWILIDLAMSVATGEPFWRWNTQRGRVLYVNFEIPKPFFVTRLQSVARAKGVIDLSNMDHWSLRGHAAPMWQLLPDMLDAIGSGKYSLIVLDPVYKLLGGRDENSAGDIGELCNEIERLAVKSGAAVVFGAHYSKGNAAAKEAMDRIGGSGVFARDADTILTLTKHKAPNAFAVDLILRNHPEQFPFVISWEFPLMRVNDDLSAKDLHGEHEKAQPRKAKTKEDLLALVPVDESIPKTTLIDRASANGIGCNKARSLLYDLLSGKHPALKEEPEKRDGTRPVIVIRRA